MSSVSYKNRMLVFGGVVDREEHHHKVESVFYNDMMAMDIERRKWFPLRINKVGTDGKKSRRRQKGDDNDNGKEDEAKTEDNCEDSSSNSDLEEDIVEDENDENQNNYGWDINL